MLPGRSRISRRSMSIAAVWTFLPDSQRETVFAPRRSRRARSVWFRLKRSRIARISFVREA